MTARRWVCPACGAGVLAPERPRKDDTRRYCLPCSAKTGRLVERTCPALDKARVERAARSAARTVTTRQRAAEAERAKHTAGPYDLIAEAKRFMRLPAMAGLKTFPAFEFRRSAHKWQSTGTAWDTWPAARITITIGTNPHDAPGVVLHEMVHALLPGEQHSTLFWSTLQRAAREAWPKARFDFANNPNGWRCQAAIADGLRTLAEGE